MCYGGTGAKEAPTTKLTEMQTEMQTRSTPIHLSLSLSLQVSVILRGHADSNSSMCKIVKLRQEKPFLNVQALHSFSQPEEACCVTLKHAYLCTVCTFSAGSVRYPYSACFLICFSSMVWFCQLGSKTAQYIFCFSCGNATDEQDPAMTILLFLLCNLKCRGKTHTHTYKQLLPQLNGL